MNSHEDNPLHTGLRSLLESAYGVPRSERRIIVIIEDGKPLEVRAEYTPRPTPAYDAFVESFAENRFEQATPSPFKRVSPEVCRAAVAAGLNEPLPDAVQQLLDENPGATLSTMPIPNSITVSFNQEEKPPWD